jgi:hypothetical protein
VFPDATSTFYTYVWLYWDMLDILAQRLYNTSDAWTLIMDYNPEITDALNIAPGTQLRMPNAWHFGKWQVSKKY